jgi:hypothetical protein
MTDMGAALQGQWLVLTALVVLGTAAVLCGSQLITALVLGKVFAGAAGHAIWIVWPNAPELFLRATLFYGLGFVVSLGCAGLLAASLWDQHRHQKTKSRS